MRPKMLALLSLLILSAGMPTTARALSMADFVRICEAASIPCSEHPIINAYVGGALDLIAMLDEETDYLDTVYCESPQTLFDVPTIIQYMEGLSSEYADKNAMLVLIRYLEEHGGCTPR